MLGIVKDVPASWIEVVSTAGDTTSCISIFVTHNCPFVKNAHFDFSSREE